MRQGLYCVLDVRINLYAMPFFSQADASAQRTFADAVLQGDSLLSRHPEDFVLVRIADVEDATGAVSTPVTPMEIMRGRDVKSRDVKKPEGA